MSNAINVDLPLSIKQCLDVASQKLSSADSESDAEAAKLEAEVLLAFILNKPRSYLYTWPERTLDVPLLENFDDAIQRRYSGEPVAYITGVREFWGLSLKVSPDVLIPRPETERLIEIALNHIPEKGNFQLADLGTGSGAIALAIASERPDALIEATDVSKSALAVARQNCASLELTNVHFRQGRWFEAFSDEKFDFVISNPPYVAEQDPHLQQGDLRFEPSTALSSGLSGLEDIEQIIKSAPAYLRNGGYLLLEHGFDQADAVINLFENTCYCEVQSFEDYGARERATLGRCLK